MTDKTFETPTITPKMQDIGEKCITSAKPGIEPWRLAVKVYVAMDYARQGAFDGANFDERAEM